MEKLIQIKSNDLKPRPGRVLIAEPLMDEFYFGRSVVLMIEHNDEGSFGMVMNKPTTSKLHELVEGFPEFEEDVFIGGPVQTDNLYYIHTLGEEIPGSTAIQEGLYWGGELDAVKEMITLGMLRPDQIRFFLGYSGWSPGQLDDELKRNAWVVSNTTPRVLMHTRPHKMWNVCLQRMGPAYDLWRRFPLNPELN
jgi:putative transcriptional regulator